MTTLPPLHSASQAIFEILAPLSGRVVPLAEVPDPVFSGGLFGDGIGIDPVEGRLVAPCAGVITHIARTGHAVTLLTQQGAEVLLHIGIDTVDLHGDGFRAKVEQGARVSAGDLLVEFDLDAVACAARSLVSVVAIANAEAFEVVKRASGRVEAGRSKLLSLRAQGPAGEAAALAAANLLGCAAAGNVDPASGAITAALVDPAASGGHTVGGAAHAADAVRRACTLTQPGGLHARPAARAREAVRGLDARVEVAFGGKRAPIESVVGLLSLGAGEQAVIELIGTGPQAAQAVEAVARELEQAAHAEQEGAAAHMRRAVAAPVPAQPGGAPLDPNTLAGVCAAPGIAIGTLVRGDGAEIAPPELASGTLAAESRLLDRALATVDADLDATVRAASQRGAHGEAGIFAMHRVLLEDPTLLDAARDLISLGKSAGYAWHAVTRMQTDILEKLYDPLLAERAADLRDLDKRIQRALGYGNAGTGTAAARSLPDDAVLAAEEFTPSDLAALDRAKVAALVMARGGATSHAAIIARQLGIPALVAVGDALHAIPDGTQVVVDATAGRLEYAPTALDIERARLERQRLAGVRAVNRELSNEAAATRDGRAIEVAANIATLEDAVVAVENGADAVGLLRTELMFIHRPAAPTQSEQREAYQSIVAALQGRRAIIRTLDVGADKEVDYLTLPPEPNPALGLRGIRLAQVRPDLLDDQLHALLAVEPFGAVRILLPMVTEVAELIRIRARIDAFAQAMGRTVPIEVGVMIEVPSAALLADQLARHADFLSIGTNDLTQYTLAMDRCRSDLAAQSDGLHPAVLRLIDATVRGADKHGKWVGVCGALAGDPVAAPVLIGLGVTELSVDPVAVPEIKALVRGLDYPLCRQRAQDLLALESAQAVRTASREIWPLQG